MATQCGVYDSLVGGILNPRPAAPAFRGRGSATLVVRQSGRLYWHRQDLLVVVTDSWRTD